MSTACFWFYGRLKDFLRRDQRDQPIRVDFRGRQSIKHLAESLGAPHPEIGRIRVNGEDGTLNTLTQDRDRVELYPIENIRPSAPRFLLDCHLGRLAAHLRMLGFDCLYQNDYEDSAMAEIIQREERILLTRDRRLLMRKVILQGYCLRSPEPREQLLEVIARFGLKDRIQPFHRCLRCNQPLEMIGKDLILDRLEELTRKYFDEFHICPNCKQIYWKGSHYERMRELIEEIGSKD
ncbi:MAG TPA: Mut7-C RNAse domain-containing protein [Anaerolineales bacterium]|nr:Mut7-C RNAse domain-containing protein [Anaerolineales bacterium]